MIYKDYNFEILPTVDATDGVAFGVGQHMSLDDDGFAPGSDDWQVQDSVDPMSGVTMFGREVLVGPSWGWQLHVNRSTAAEALQTLGEFKAAWRARQIRDIPGAVLPLRYMLDGRMRRIYGRPRRFDAPPDNQILSGYVPVAVDFKCVDAYTYDDVETVAVMQLGQEFENPEAADAGGGWIFPVIFPHVTLPPTLQQMQVLIEGDAPAYPIVRFAGPVVNPTLTTDHWALTVTMAIQPGEYVEIDTRPWKQTALLNGVTSVAGLLGRRTRLSKTYLEPGRFEARYTGASSATSTCVVRWANAWNSL